MIMRVDYFKKWIEEKVISKITIERVCRFYWQRIMCKFDLLGIIVSDNGTLYQHYLVDFYNDLGV